MKMTEEETMKTCMVGYTFYEKDNRVRRYAECLVRHGHQVDVVALRSKGQEDVGVLKGVRVYRIQERTIDEKVKAQYFVRIMRFFFRSFYFLHKHHQETAYDLVHIHSVPDFEVFAALMPKLKGAKVILDIHDIVPEFYASKFHVGRDSFAFKLLVTAERLSVAFSDHVIISNDIWKKKLIHRTVKEEKCTTIINYPDPELFSGKQRKNNTDEIVFLYPGSLNWHQGLDIAVRAFAQIKDDIPNARFDIYGSGPEEETILNLAEHLEISDRVAIHAAVNMEDVAELMVSADIGIIPKRNDPFGGDAFSTKTLEFMLSGTPVIVSKTRVDDFYFDDSVVMFFEPENVEDLARCMRRLATDKEKWRQQAKSAQAFAEQMSWKNKETIYLDIIDNLLHR
jgi:glycosyltransferase involved in cell wall biosynthesis